MTVLLPGQVIKQPEENDDDKVYNIKIQHENTVQDLAEIRHYEPYQVQQWWIWQLVYVHGNTAGLMQ